MKKKEKPLKKPHIIRRILCVCISAILCGGMIALDVLASSPTVSHTISTFLTGGINVTDKEKKLDSYANAEKTAKAIAEEGIVLLKNENNTLPLEGIDKVNLFGYASANTNYSPSGSSTVDENIIVNMREGFKSVGIEVNDDLYDKYLNYEQDAVAMEVVEPSIDDTNFYTEDLWKSYEDYSDVAIMVLGRSSGEGADLTHGYLSISQNERDLLTELEDRFGTVIVVINSGNAMELGFLEEEGVDAALLVGYTGCNGTEALAEIMTGTVDPSAKTVDTYAYDHTTAPSYYTSGVEGTRQYAGMEADENTGENYYYVDYKEGIYVGYRYYETRYVDNETGEVDEEAYRNVVQYPFGYGLSYTTFEQELLGYTGKLDTDKASDISVQVRVTNTGDMEGKEVVEVYATPPYTVGGIEKSAVNLVGYAKTGMLEPGEAEDVTVTFSTKDLASYDYNDANENGHTGYELETGDYNISLRSDAHTIIDSFVLTAEETHYYDTDTTTDVTITNQFEEAAGDGETEDIVYLSRADWDGTLVLDGREDSTIDTSEKSGMSAYTIHYTMGREASEDVKNSVNAYYEEHYADEDDTDAEMPVTGKDNGLTISDMAGLDYDDPQWEDLLDQLSVSDMKKLIGSGSMGIGSLKSIGLDQTSSNDGTLGIVAAYSYNGGTAEDSCAAYPNESVLAASWNNDLAYEQGAAVAYEADAVHVTTWYAPGANIHRTPYGGRNCDYYSEDGIISGNMAANVISGGQDNGLTVMIKHFALNEQETARNVDGIYSWCNEQAIREIYLPSFEIAVKDGGCKAIMSSFNRIGATWTGAHKGLLTNVLRDEWGYKGVVETDAYVPSMGDNTYYMMMDTGLRAGNDIWLQGFGSDAPSTDINEAYTVQLMRESCHRILYSIADGKHLTDYETNNTWKVVLVVVNLVIFALCAHWIYRMFFRYQVLLKRRAKKAEGGEERA